MDSNKVRRRYKETDPGKYKEFVRRTNLRAKYDLTPDQVAAMVKEQDGKCALCGRPPTARGLFIDHDHKTGRVRKLLCQYCNMGLGHFKEDVALLQKAIEYILCHRST
jgi:hypothetical protein